MSKILLKAFMIIMLLNPFIVFAQDSSNVDSSSTAELNLSSDESSIQFSDSDFESTTSQKSDSALSTIWTFVKMVVLLLIVVACIYGVFFLFKRNSNALNVSDPFLRKVSQVNLSPGKSVQIVTLLDNAYIIGVTDNAINLIGQVNDKELVDSMNVYADKNDKTSRPRSFSDVLDIFMSKGNRSGNVFGDSDIVTNTLRQQRENFNGNYGEREQ